MDYDQLAYDLQNAPGIRLLKADHAALIIGFLHRQFKREQRIAIPLPELAERLANTLEALNEQARDLTRRYQQEQHPGDQRAR